MLPFLGAVGLVVVLALLLVGERAFERGRRRLKAPPKRLRPPDR
jgi:hypothetical protein